MPTAAGYDVDFYTWLNRQADALRARESEVLDWDHLAEEIEAMAGSQKRELTSHLKTLLIHLLKWKCQADRRSASWKNSIENARDELADMFEQSPSLRNRIGEVLPKAYIRATREAANEMRYREQQKKTAFPPQCPWTFEQLMDETFSGAF